MTSNAGSASIGETRDRLVYRWYVTVVLTFCYALSFVDSKLPLILVQSIKADLSLTDTQIGILTGPAFSLTYALAVVPISRLSDRLVRKYVIAAAIAVWSCFTAAGGFALAFVPLVLSRTGVAIGEGALTPAAHSMIADMFPERARPRALAVYFSGIAVGTFLALYVGGWMNDRYGWRAAMFLVGACGIALMLLLIFTVAEPGRASSAKVPALDTRRETVWTLFADPVIRHTVIGGTLICVAGGACTWFPAYMIRTFSMTASRVGVTYGPAVGLSGLIGTLFGGLFCAWLSRRDWSRTYRFFAVTFVAAAVLEILALTMKAYPDFLVLASLAILLLALYPSPTFAVIQSRVGSGSRSFASAVTLFCFNGVGLAFGAFITGWLSDYLSSGDSARSLRMALLIVSLATVWGAFHYLVASFHLCAPGKRAEALDSRVVQNDLKGEL